MESNPCFLLFKKICIYIFISLYRVLSKREREINKNQSTEKDHCSDTENKVRTLNYKQPPLSLSLSLFWVCLYILKYWFFKIKKKKVLQIVTFTFSFFVIFFFFFFFKFWFHTRKQDRLAGIGGKSGRTTFEFLKLWACRGYTT